MHHVSYPGLNEALMLTRYSLLCNQRNKARVTRGPGGRLDLGKARARAMVESFGGKVTSSVSGKTHVLLAGPASQCTAAHHVIHQRERETLPRV